MRKSPILTATLGFLAGIALAVGLFLYFAREASDRDVEIPVILGDGSPAPSPQVTRAAKRGIEQYRDTRPYKDKWILYVRESNDLIETNWYPEHKGEILLKVQVAVWGSSFRVDAWQRVGLLMPSPAKTDWSRRTERKIQNAIEDEIKRQP